MKTVLSPGRKPSAGERRRVGGADGSLLSFREGNADGHR